MNNSNELIPELSVIIPIYNEANQLPHTIKALEPILTANTTSFEVIFIDDGSSDASWSIITDIATANPCFKGLKFSRNFGKEAALCAGLDQACGQAVLIMDADLQHPPELIPEFLRQWRSGFDVVEGVKTDRGQESKLYRYLAQKFYLIFKNLTNVNLANASDFKLLDRKVVDAWLQFRERTTFFRGLVNWLGFKSTTIAFEVQPRLHGQSKWGSLALIHLAFNAIIAFSAKPLQMVTVLGLGFILAAVILAIHTLVNFLNHNSWPGFTTVILLQLIIGGIITSSLGIIGIYISKIYEEIKGRPRYLLSDQTTVNETDTATKTYNQH